ncbi:hypothetical protein CDAR_227271 [Caerostris darwini]|uniref:Ycf15 n=1 Tax=Caerostris darwini TaxID=1538125 RepID=A0AAV4ULS1_9ARAC|nr:hypothetical protein CDAR_227271 [Caerostris darwini]
MSHQHLIRFISSNCEEWLGEAGGGRGCQVKFICISSTLSGRLNCPVKRSPEVSLRNGSRKNRKSTLPNHPLQILNYLSRPANGFNGIG